MGDVSKKLMDQFADNLNTMLDAEPDGADGDAATPAADGRQPTAPPTAPAESALGADTPRAAAPAAEPPTVRKIDGPASEPIDLSGDGRAGDPQAPRCRCVVGLLLLLFILRRRRT